MRYHAEPPQWQDTNQQHFQHIVPFNPSSSTKVFDSLLLHLERINFTSLPCLFLCTKKMHTSLTLPIIFLTSTSEHELAIGKFIIWLQQQWMYVAKDTFVLLHYLHPFLHLPLSHFHHTLVHARRCSPSSPSSSNFSRIVEAIQHLQSFHDTDY